MNVAPVTTPPVDADAFWLDLTCPPLDPKVCMLRRMFLECLEASEYDLARSILDRLQRLDPPATA